MEWSDVLNFGVVIVRSVFAFFVADGVVPDAGFVGRKMGPPDLAGTCGTVGGVAVGGEVSGDGIFGRTGFVAEDDLKHVVGERIERVLFVNLRAFGTESDFVPLLEAAVNEDILSE